jgi:hypothetical protein
MNSKIASRRVLRLLQSSVATGLILLLLAIAPFAVAQDVHHELAAADHDGHEHSDTDLCQWLQRTLFCFPSNYPRPALLALLPASSHVISILTILARSSSDCLPTVVSF